MESIFSFPAAYFGDKADDIDTALHERLREAMKDIGHREIIAAQQAVEANAEKLCGKCTCCTCGINPWCPIHGTIGESTA